MENVGTIVNMGKRVCNGVWSSAKHLHGSRTRQFQRQVRTFHFNAQFMCAPYIFILHKVLLQSLMGCRCPTEMRFPQNLMKP